MFRPEHLATAASEVWTADIAQHGMLWPGPIVIEMSWMAEHDCYLVMLYNPGRLYSYLKLRPPRLTEAVSLCTWIDRQIAGLRQTHFMRQAAERGGYY